jgi:hypothetical protein
MAPRTKTPAFDLTPSVEQATAFTRQATRYGIDVWEAAATSFIGHQVEIANLKRRMTAVSASMARDALR